MTNYDTESFRQTHYIGDEAPPQVDLGRAPMSLRDLFASVMGVNNVPKEDTAADDATPTAVD